MKKTLLAILGGAILPTCIHAAVFESFTAKTANDVDMTFTITAEGAENTVETGGTWGRCIDWEFTGDVVVPASVTYNGVTYTVTAIGEFSFPSCYFSSITLPNTIREIKKHGIYSSRYLTSLEIPASVVAMEEGAIAQNPLTSLTVAEGNKNFVAVDNVLFNKDMTTLLQYACNKPDQYYTIPSSVTRIADLAFNNCDLLVEVTIPNSVKEIGEDGFHQCDNLARVFIPASVISIGARCFTGYNYALKSIDVDPANPAYTSVGGVLYTKDMSTIVCYPVANDGTSYNIWDGSSEIYGGAFSDADKLNSVYIPNTVTNIGYCAFFSCNSLQSIDIPASVTYIGSQAFDYCYNLTKAYFHSAVPPKTGGSIFGGVPDLTIFAPYTSLKAYREHPYLTKVHIDPSLDWHTEDDYYVMCCVVGLDFTKSTGIRAYKVVLTPGYTPGTSRSIRVPARKESTASSPIMLVEIEKAGPGDCVLLQAAEPGGTIELYEDETAENLTDNLLKGASDEETTAEATDGENTNFIFDGENFIPVVGSEGIDLGSGYLQIPTTDVTEENITSLAVEDLPGFNDTPVPTGLWHPIIPASQPSGVVYNLQGQRTTTAKKGLYIVDGRKVVMM